MGWAAPPPSICSTPSGPCSTPRSSTPTRWAPPTTPRPPSSSRWELPSQPRRQEPIHERPRPTRDGGARRPGPVAPHGRVRPACREGGREERRSEEHTSELQSRENLVCRLLLEKKNSCTRLLDSAVC